MEDSQVEEPGQYVPPPKQGVHLRAVGYVKNNWKLLVTLGVSFGIGLGTATLLQPGDEPVDLSSIAVEVIPGKFVASSTRRIEPITPIIPFEDLEPGVVKIGHRLFNDLALSNNGRISCASCHDLATGGVASVSIENDIADSGEAATTEHQLDTTTVFNAALNASLFWDGRVQTLEKQLDTPVESAHELGSSWERVLKYLSKEPIYRQAFAEHMGGRPTEDRVREALATYERSLVLVNSPFDRWLGGEESALTADELSGYFSFRELNCVSCHQGATVGGSMFQPLGSKLKAFFANKRALSDLDLGRFRATERESDKYVFRVPPLRTAASTAPYFHDGSVATLEEAVEVMIRTQTEEEPNPEVVRRICLFIKSLEGTLQSEHSTTATEDAEN